MKPVSNYYKQKIASGETRNFEVLIYCNLADNIHHLTFTEADIMDGSFKILTASSGQSSFDIGAAIIGKCQFTLKNFNDEYAGLDFFNAEATVWLKLVGDENYHRMGFFTVDEPQYSGSMVSLELLDNMWKFDKDLPSIPLPQTIGQIVNRLCTHCGVGLGTETFNGSAFQITELPDTVMNCRTLLQYLAMIGCNFCQINDNGSLDVKWYDVLSRPEADLDGGSFSTSTTPYSDGDSADGGNFTNYDSGDDYDGGVFAENNDIAYFTRLFTRNVGTDEITITGVKIKIGDTDYLRGNEGYVLVLENPLVTESNVTTILNMIWNRLRGFKLRTYNVTALPDLAPEVGDCVAISYKGNMVYSYLTNYTFTPSLSTASLGAVTPTRTLSQRYSKAVQAAVEVARQNVREQIGIYDLSAQRMNQLAINAMGGYTDYDDLPTGGRVYYLSNAPITKNATTGMCQFPDSAIVYKTTGEGFFVSTSGSVDPQTHERIWTQGYTPSTGLLVELLTALRINAEQMYTGVLEVGGSQIGVTKPYIRVLDVNDDPVCTINHEGITMHQGLIQSPDYEEETPVGTFSDTGMMIDVLNSILKSPFFALNNNGAYLKGEIQATSGKIGAADITPYSIVIRGDVELYNGSGTFTFRPTDYYFADDFYLTLTTEEGTTSSVTLVKHENGSDTTVGTYSVTDAGITTALLDHTIGTDEEDYYQLTITGSDTQVLADDVILAYMGREGFRGTLSGIFRGYLDSRSGKIGDMKYNGQSFDLTFGNELRFNHGDDSIVLDFSNHTITRYYTDGGVVKSNDVAWGRKQNYIEQELLFPEYPPTDAGDTGDLLIQPHEYKTNKESLWRCSGGTSWDEVDLSGSWVTYSDSAPSQSQGKYGDVHLKFDSPAAVILGGGTLQSIYTYSGAATNPWVENSVGGGGIIDYSTTEQDTGMKYLNGSSIYQRSFLLSTALSLVSNTWTNAIQSSTIGEIISAEGKNADGDMIGIIGRVNNGYIQVLSLMTATQTLSILTLKYLKALGGYAFNENYQQGSTYTFEPTIEPETFLIWAIKHFIQVCKSKGSDWNTAPVFSYVLTNITSIVSHFMQYKDSNNGIGVTLNAFYEFNEFRMSIFVAFTNGNKTGRVDQGYTAHGDESKYIWGNKSQSSLWATRGEYWVKITASGQESWVTPEWAYTMYSCYIGVKYYDGESSTTISTDTITNYGIHLL